MSESVCVPVCLCTCMQHAGLCVCVCVVCVRVRACLESCGLPIVPLMRTIGVVNDQMGATGGGRGTHVDRYLDGIVNSKLISHLDLFTS